MLHFVHLRADSLAQYEIRVYAETILKILKVWMPYTYEAFLEFRLGAFTLSRSAIVVISKLLSGERVTREESNLTASEWREVQNAFKIK